MLHGLLWFPLLGLFIWLAWAGRREFRQVEAYRTWAGNFDTAKYDNLAVLGLKGDRLTWGQPTPAGPCDCQERTLTPDLGVELWVDGDRRDLEAAVASGRRAELRLLASDCPVASIPFTNPELARNWALKLKTVIAVAASRPPIP
jgi:hypothetical protein